MRSLSLVAALSAFAALVAALNAACGDAQGHLPGWALFSFAVSAFREPLR